MTDIEDRLERAARHYQQARDLFEERQDGLHTKIREARDEGLSLRRIAELSGLSFGRIHQLTRNADANDEPDARDLGRR